MADVPLILASSSPFRRRMLEAAGVVVDVRPADIDEDVLKRQMLDDRQTPIAIAQALAQAKAEDVSRPAPEALVIGADQILELDGALVSKPVGRTDGRAQLLSLRGKSHRLHTAAVLATGGKAVWNHVETATLTMRAFSDSFLARYLEQMGDRICHTVGGYEIEGTGIQLFERVEGDTFTIIGLPLLPLLAELRRHGTVAA